MRWVILTGVNVPKAVPWITTICEICGKSFDRQPAFHRSAESKGGKVRFCSSTCFGAARKTGIIAAFCKTGKITITCEMCGTPFERWPSAIKWANATNKGVRFCSRACHGSARTARIVRMPEGTTEVNKKRSDGNRAAWGLPPHDNTVMNLSKALRARAARGIGFNASQLRDWLATSCVRCGSIDQLELDHIICMASGGKSERDNAQTLCRPCNRWKVKHIDRPFVRQLTQMGYQPVAKLV